MKETEKTEKLAHCVRYIYDPEDNSTKCTVLSAKDESTFPEYGKVIHYSGKRYSVYFKGKHDTLDKRQTAFNLFKQFYLNKLSDAAQEVSKFATILTYFE